MTVWPIWLKLLLVHAWQPPHSLVSFSFFLLLVPFMFYDPFFSCKGNECYFLKCRKRKLNLLKSGLTLNFNSVCQNCFHTLSRIWRPGENQNTLNPGTEPTGISFSERRRFFSDVHPTVIIHGGLLSYKALFTDVFYTEIFLETIR